MKKILFIALLLLSLMVCVTSPAWAGGWDDVEAATDAAAGGDFDKAFRLFTKAIEINPNHAEAYINRGNAWGKKGDLGKAKADLDKAKEIYQRKN